MKSIHLYNTAHPLADAGKPIFIPFGEWKYDSTRRQRLDRAHGERIANELNARVARGEPGIPVYQGHPDVPELASKYPDKGALGWVTKIELVNEVESGGVMSGGVNSPTHNSPTHNSPRSGLALTVEWDRDPGKGFKWFSPYWFANERDRDGVTYIVSEISSIGLVNNPNIPEFRLANEAEDNETKNKERNKMNREELIRILGLPPEATDDQIMELVGELKRIADDKAAAEERAKAEAKAEAKADLDEAKAEAETAKAALENEKKAHAATKAALANEKSMRADAALDRAVAEKRIGATARETWKTRLVNEGEPAYTALANEKPMGGKDHTVGLVNSCGEGSDHEKRLAMVNEIMEKEKCGYDDAWNRAEKRDPALFGK